MAGPERHDILASPGGRAAIMRRFIMGESVASIARSFEYDVPGQVYDAMSKFIQMYAHRRWGKSDRVAVARLALSNWAMGENNNQVDRG